jgi:ribosomal protein S18 acetylase RimI-like enzyme
MLRTINVLNVTTRFEPAPPTVAPDLSHVCQLTENDVAETLAFLAIRPVHTVVMTSFIRDNGIESELNRGRFFGYLNEKGELEGVALIGHSTLVEARTHRALKALAFAARRSETPIHLVMSHGSDAETFWYFLTGGVREPRLSLEEELFEVSFPFAVQRTGETLRRADMSELEEVAAIQAELAFMETGTDPMQMDREGFFARVARRIEQERVFVVTIGGKLAFKADVIAETDHAAYLEGVYVAPEFRGRGLGPKCLAEVGLELLNRVERVCLLSNVEFTTAHRAYRKAGFKNTDRCTTLVV